MKHTLFMVVLAAFAVGAAASPDDQSAQRRQRAREAKHNGAADSASALVSGYPIMPNGYTLDAYLDCGGPPSADNARGAAISLLAGNPIELGEAPGPVGTAFAHAEQVEFDITGLEPDAEYALGFTWWDDGSGRVQSVRFATGEPETWTTVLPAAAPLAFHKDKPVPARVLLPITAPFRQAGRLRVAFAREAGPNAVVSKLWLFKAPANDTHKRVLLLTGDDYAGHLWQETAPELAALLREDARLEVWISEAPIFLASPLLDHYDAVVLHFKNYEDRMPLGSEVGAGLERFIAAGKGLVVAHFGCGAFQEWHGYVDVVGRIWNPEMRGHDPHGPFTLRVVDAEHPITKGMADFDTVDELYTCLDGKPDIDVLIEARSKVDDKDYAIGFVVPTDSGRVFHCTLGHDTASLQPRGVRRLYQRATAWAAGLDPDTR